MEAIASILALSLTDTGAAVKAGRSSGHDCRMDIDIRISGSEPSQEVAE